MLLNQGKYTYVNLLFSGIRELRWKDDSLILKSINDHIVIYITNEIETLYKVEESEKKIVDAKIHFMKECLKRLDIKGIYIDDNNNDVLDTVGEIEKKKPFEFREKLRGIGYPDYLFKLLLLIGSLNEKDKTVLDNITKYIPIKAIKNINERYLLVETIYK